MCVGPEWLLVALLVVQHTHVAMASDHRAALSRSDAYARWLTVVLAVVLAVAA